MLVYEKKVNNERHLFGTMGNIPAENDVQLTYKDETGTIITPIEKDTYLDNGVGGIFRKSDEKAVNVFIGDKCIIGEDVKTVAVHKAPAKKIDVRKTVKVAEEKKVEEKEPEIKEEPEQVEAEIKEEE